MDLSEIDLKIAGTKNGRKCFMDPIRKQLVYATPEEGVRQRLVQYLLETLKVPSDMIFIEESLSVYGVHSDDRPDIIINYYDKQQNGLMPLCVIECKAPQKMLNEHACDQLYRYCEVLSPSYAVLTNGYDTLSFCYSELDGYYLRIETLPDYMRLLSGEHVWMELEDPPKRMTHDEIACNASIYYGTDIGKDTPEALLVPMVNFWEGLLDTSHKLPCRTNSLLKVKTDLGVRMLSVGNASGGMFQGPYRSFEVVYKGNTVIVSLALSSYVTSANPDCWRTIIAVATERDGQQPHHALQLNVDRNISVTGTKVTFFHDGRIAVGKKGSGKRKELLRMAAESYTEIVDTDRFNLGTLTDDHLWRLDDSDMANVVENFLAYALIRDEYRAVKNGSTQ